MTDLEDISGFGSRQRTKPKNEKADLGQTRLLSDDPKRGKAYHRADRAIREAWGGTWSPQNIWQLGWKSLNCTMKDPWSFTWPYITTRSSSPGGGCCRTGGVSQPMRLVFAEGMLEAVSRIIWVWRCSSFPAILRTLSSRPQSPIVINRQRTQRWMKKSLSSFKDLSVTTIDVCENE